MRVGNFRHKVTFERQTTTKNALGEKTLVFTTVAVRRVSIEPLMGREYYTSSGEHAELTTRIRARYDTTVGTLKPSDRVVDYTVSPGAVYDIQNIANPNNRDRELVMMCLKRY